MKTLVFYQCEICGEKYQAEEDARECEARGPTQLLPRGLVWAWTDDALYKDFTFASAVSKADERFKHSRIDSLWACRPMPYSDSLGKEKCGSGGKATPSEYKPEWEQLQTFARMVAWLLGNDINPLVMVDGQFIPLSEARKSVQVAA